jgi:hypothetical protein
MPDKLHVRPKPCATCPYRRDVPSGVWAPEEYAKLPIYDCTTTEQGEAGAFEVFVCHTAPETHVCSGWVATIDTDESMAIRIACARGQLDREEVESYTSPVPLFASGAEAAGHGMRDVDEQPGEARAAAMRKVEKIRERIGHPVLYRE